MTTTNDSESNPASTDEAGEVVAVAEEVGPTASKAGERLAELENEGDIAADYLEALLDIGDLDGDIDMDVEGDRAMVGIVGDDLNQLVGSNGKVLDALQELTRLAVTQQTGDRSRLMLDVAGFRAARRQQLTDLGSAACDRAKDEGQAVKLEPMTPFERKIVHDAVAAAGLKSESEGDEPNRFVVVIP